MPTHEVKLCYALRKHADGADTVLVQANSIRQLFQNLEDHYPGMASLIKQGVAVSVNGTLYRDSWNTPLPEGSEVYLLPRIQGG